LSVAVAITVRVVVANTASHWLEFGDYRIQVQPALDALLRGDLSSFLHANTLGGPASLLLRAPMLALARALGGGESLGYTLGSLACALPLTALAVWLIAETGRLRRRLVDRASIAALFALCPIFTIALQWGHPEDLMTIAACVAAVLLAARGRIVWAGLVFGLAVATKQWALVAAAPILLAMPRYRLRAAFIGGGLVALLAAPAALIDPHAFVASFKSIASVNSWVSATNVWWPLADAHTRMVADGVTLVPVIKYTLPASLNYVPHALIVLMGLPLGAALAARSQRPTLDQVLSLLALLMLLRCALDPWDNPYYQVAPLVALYARDALCGRRIPLASAFATLAAWVTFGHVAIVSGGLGRLAFGHAAGMTNLVYLLWTAPLAVWLTLNAFELRAPRLLRLEFGRAHLGREAATSAPPAQAA
jgi:Glycosyltransferase family 87